MTDQNIQDEIRAIIRNPNLFDKSSNFNVGFFSRPFLIDQGILRGKVIKTYRPVNDYEYCKRVQELHDIYVIDLREAGILVPETILEIVEIESRYHLAIIQEAFTTQELVRDVMKVCDVETYLDLAEGVLREAISFSNYMMDNSIQLGFHPTLRNYAFRMGKYYYFDTFPPMSNLSERELQRLIVDFAPYNFPEFVKKACRLRPEFADRVLIRSKSVLENVEIDETIKAETLEIIKNPPKLSPLWTSLRRLLGKEGNPNV